MSGILMADLASTLNMTYLPWLYVCNPLSHRYYTCNFRKRSLIFRKSSWFDNAI